MYPKIFGWAEYTGCPPNVIVGWAIGHRPPPRGSSCTLHIDTDTVSLKYTNQLLVLSVYKS